MDLSLIRKIVSVMTGIPTPPEGTQALLRVESFLGSIWSAAPSFVSGLQKCLNDRRPGNDVLETEMIARAYTGPFPCSLMTMTQADAAVRFINKHGEKVALKEAHWLGMTTIQLWNFIVRNREALMKDLEA